MKLLTYQNFKLEKTGDSAILLSQFEPCLTADRETSRTRQEIRCSVVHSPESWARMANQIHDPDK